MSKPLMKCHRCGVEKAHDQFYHDKSKANGFKSTCIECEKKRLAQAKGHTVKLKEIEPDLSVILKLPRSVNSRGWTLDQAKKLLQCYILSRRENIRLADVLKNVVGVDHGLASCAGLIVELKKAAIAGMSIEEYWKERKFNPHNEVVGVGKKRK